MSDTRSSADLRNHDKESSDYAVSGKEDASCESLEEFYQTVEFMQKLNEGLADVAQGRVVDLLSAKKLLV